MNSKLPGTIPALSLLFLIVGFPSVYAAEFDGDSITGHWTTDRGSIVQFEKSGEQFYGVVIAVPTPTPEQREEIDRENPENFGKVQSDFDTPDLIGVLVLRGLEYRGKGVWKGEFYNDRRHKNFNAKITLSDLDTMSLRINAVLEEKMTLSWTRLKD